VIDLAIAAAIAASAPADLKPCPRPEKIENPVPHKRQGPRVVVQHKLLERVVKKTEKGPPRPLVDCDEGPPPSPTLTLILPPPVVDVPTADYTPAPPETFEQIATSPPDVVVSENDSFASGSGGFASFGSVIDTGYLVAGPCCYCPPDLVAAPVPEPSPWVLLAFGILSVVGWKARS
jgi:hypothetical protein